MESLKQVYCPEWGREVVGYAKHYLWHNVGRTGVMYDVDDLLQEAYVVFLRISSRYEFVNAKHFMGMWKRALGRMVSNVVKIQARHYAMQLVTDGLEEDGCGDLVPYCLADPKAALVQAQTDYALDFKAAPALVKKLIVGAKRKHSCGKLRGRTTTNEHLCRVANVDASEPLRDQFERWLSGTPQVVADEHVAAVI